MSTVTSIFVAKEMKYTDWLRLRLTSSPWSWRGTLTQHTWSMRKLSGCLKPIAVGTGSGRALWGEGRVIPDNHRT